MRLSAAQPRRRRPIPAPASSLRVRDSVSSTVPVLYTPVRGAPSVSALTERPALGATGCWCSTSDGGAPVALQLIDIIHLVLRMLLGPPAATSQVPPPLNVPSQRCPRRAAQPRPDRCVRARCGRLPWISASRLHLDAQAAASLSCSLLASTSSRTESVRLAAVVPRRAFRMFVCVCEDVACDSRLMSDCVWTISRDVGHQDCLGTP